MNDFSTPVSKRIFMSRKLHFFSIALLVALPICPGRAAFEARGFDENAPAPEFPAPEERAPGFRPGERFEYRGAWGIFNAAATIILTTDMELSDGRELFHIGTRARTNGFVRMIYPADTVSDSFLDPESWSVLSSHLEGRTGKDDNQVLTTIDYDRRLIIHQDDIEPEKSYTHPLPMDPVLDFVSAFLQMRGMPLEVGKSFPVLVHGGGRFYFGHVDVVGREVKKSVFGRIPSFALKPRTEKATGVFAGGGGVTLWVTDDEHRLPFRVDVDVALGTASLILDRYEAPGVTLGKENRR